jgi:hypothetical protein
MLVFPGLGSQVEVYLRADLEAPNVRWNNTLYLESAKRSTYFLPESHFQSDMANLFGNKIASSCTLTPLLTCDKLSRTLQPSPLSATTRRLRFVITIRFSPKEDFHENCAP